MKTDMRIEPLSEGLLHRVTHGSQKPSTVQGLHPMAEVASGTRREPLVVLLERGAPEDLREVGAHLWNQLGRPASVTNELVIVSEDDTVLSLPWNALWEDGQRLIDREVVVRCRHPAAGRERHLGKVPEVLVALPSVDSRAASSESLEWNRLQESSILGPARLHHAETAQELLQLLGHRVDLAYFPVSATSQHAEALALDGYTVPAQALEEALRHSAPQILVFGGPGAQALRFSGWLSRLAALVPCVVVVPDSTEEGDQGPGAGARWDQGPGAGARCFVSRLFQEGHSPARTCHLMARERAPSHTPLCIGGEKTPQRKLEPTSKPVLTDGWEVELDRATQVGLVHQALSSMQKAGGGCLLVVWHGPTTAGIQRLHARFRKALNSDWFALRDLELEWFRVSKPQEEDFVGLYTATLGVGALEPGELSTALQRQLPQHSHTSTTPVLYLHHGVLSASLYPQQLDEVVIRNYLHWWSQTFVPACPRNAILVLSLAITTPSPPEADWPQRLQDMLEEARGVLGDWFLPLEALGNVRLGDVTEFLQKHMGRTLSQPEDRRAVAQEIMARTGGVYERVIRELEHVDYNWNALRDAWRRRQR